MKHIVFGESAAGTMAIAFEKQEIIAFPDFLGEGSIQGLLTEQGLNERTAWLSEAFRIDGTAWGAHFTDAIQKLAAVTEQDSVLIWASENAAEQFGLRLVCTLLASKNCPVYFCDTYENMLHMHRARNLQMEIRHSGEMNIKQMRMMYEQQQYRELSSEEIRTFGEQAKQLMQGDSLLRTWHRGQILEDVETRDDALIIHYLKELLQERDEDYVRAPRLIGHVLGFSVHDISDTWIEYRLLTLIQTGTVQYHGDLRQMRTYEVKV